MTMKKNYEKPSLQVLILQRSNLIATSGDTQNIRLNLDIDDWEEEGFAD